MSLSGSPSRHCYFVAVEINENGTQTAWIAMPLWGRIHLVVTWNLSLYDLSFYSMGDFNCSIQIHCFQMADTFFYLGNNTEYDLISICFYICMTKFVGLCFYTLHCHCKTAWFWILSDTDEKLLSLLVSMSLATSKIEVVLCLNPTKVKINFINWNYCYLKLPYV